MAANLHEQAVKLALQANDDLGALFAQMGHNRAPRGRVVSAYRKARQALSGQAGDVRQVRRVLDELDTALVAAVTTLATSAVSEGQRYARQAIAVYGETVAPVEVATDDAVSEWLDPWKKQRQRILNAKELSESQLLGAGTGLGWLTPAPVLREGSRWIGDLYGLAVAETLVLVATKREQQRDEFLKQAVAGLDERTTDCCLRVHGQTQPIKKDFVLVGEPRYADHLPNPPFHWWCRTAEALVLAEYADDELTREMRAAALAERIDRERTKQRVEIHPSDARSRRR